MSDPLDDLERSLESDEAIDPDYAPPSDILDFFETFGDDDEQDTSTSV